MGTCKCGMAITGVEFVVCDRCYSINFYTALEAFITQGDLMFVSKWVEIMKNDPNVISMCKCPGCKSWMNVEEFEYHDDDCKLDKVRLCSQTENEWIENTSIEDDPLFNGDLL